METVRAHVTDESVVIEGLGRAPLVMAGSTLRSACACAACRDSGSGQNLLDPAQVDPVILPTSVVLDGDGTLVARWPDGHESHHARSWLAAWAAPATSRPMLWDATLQDTLPRHDHDAARADAAALYRFLADVRDRGFAILGGVPCRDAEVERAAELFWYVRETNYGRHFDVLVKPDPNNLAYTARALPGHTDNPYAEPVPGLQLLHCLAQSDEGGDNTLADGFAAAERLRREDRAAFDVLARVPVAYRFSDFGADLRSERPVIQCDGAGRVTAVHVNDRSFRGPIAPAADARAFYAAYRRFIGLVRDPAAMVRIKLAPGDLLAMDNRRTLHGRAAYEAGRGLRHLQGCYVDAGGLASKLRVLARDLGYGHADAGLPGADRERDAAEHLLGVLARHGDESYLGEPISQLEHALQAAHAAELAGAPAALVVAALLHDIGHFLHDLPEDCAEQGLDSRHEDAGGAALARAFGPEVAEPVRLHVDAKRYLASAEPWYLGVLSEASILSLKLQGGPFDAAGRAAFKARPYADAAIALRRWDEAAKVPGAATPGLDHYRPMVLAATRAG
jgi:gamma-butyrobetaine dioxygenase